MKIYSAQCLSLALKIFLMQVEFGKLNVLLFFSMSLKIKLLLNNEYQNTRVAFILFQYSVIY